MAMAHARAHQETTRIGVGASRFPAIVASLIGVALVALNVAGAAYYLAPLGVRLRHPLHMYLRPTGVIGQPLGFLAIGLFLFLWLYPLRKAWGAKLSFAGPLSGWLRWHVTAGLLAPWVAATHAGWRFSGLIGLGYGAMFIVYLSGLVGRYLYVRIPRRIDGLEMSRDEATSERERLLFELAATTGLPPDEVRQMLTPGTAGPQRPGVLSSIAMMVADDLARRRAARRLTRRLASRSRNGPGALDRDALRRSLGLARREMALSQQVRMLDATHRLFGYWHAAHKPFAFTALLAVLAHVAVAFAVGAVRIP